MSLYFVLFIKQEREKEREQNWRQQKIILLGKRQQNYKRGQIPQKPTPKQRNWDPNMLLIEPLALSSGCGQNDSLSQVPDTFQQFREIETGTLSRMPGFGHQRGSDSRSLLSWVLKVKNPSKMESTQQNGRSWCSRQHIEDVCSLLLDSP